MGNEAGIANQTSSTAFQFLYTTLTVNMALVAKCIMNSSQGEQGNAVFAVHFTVKGI